MFNLEINNFCFGIYQCEDDWLVNEKGSVFHRLYYIYEGAAAFEDSDKQLLLEKGHLYLFPANRPYTINHDFKRPLKCLFFHITTYPLILNHTIDISTQDFPEIYHLIKVLEYISADKNRYEIQFINSLLESLLCLIGKEFELVLLTDERMQKVLDFIYNNFHQKISNNDLSSIVGFDHFYFIRLFKKLLGDTPQKYISKYRLNKALSLIQENTPLKEVSEKVGFEDAKAFSRAFRKYHGYPPVEYKKVIFCNLKDNFYSFFCRPYVIYLNGCKMVC